MTDSELQEVAWFSPGHYPSRCTPDLALRVATWVAKGATLLQAAGIEGCAQRVREWYKQGYDAAMRDADWSDLHAAQLDLFLKVNQAFGLAGATAQMRVFKLDPSWWLMHNPEQRAEAQTGSVMAQLNPPETVVETGREVPVVPTTPQYTRDVIRHILESPGAMVSPARNVVESDNSERKTGTNE